MIGVDGGGPNRPANQLHETGLFNMLEDCQLQRILALTKLDRLAKEQHVDTLKKYRRVLAG
jgi:GTP-binding protein EngB required for normal cell division